MDLRLQVGYYMSSYKMYTLYVQAYVLYNAKIKDIYNHAFWHIRFTDKNNRVKNFSEKKERKK